MASRKNPADAPDGYHKGGRANPLGADDASALESKVTHRLPKLPPSPHGSGSSNARTGREKSSDEESAPPVDRGTSPHEHPSMRGLRGGPPPKSR